MNIDTHPAARIASEQLLEAFQVYAEAFGRLTRSAIRRFEARDWNGLQADAEARLLLYPDSVAPLVAALGRLSLWQPLPQQAVRLRYAGLIQDRPDREIAETFYNSAIRRLHGTTGVDETAEFLDLAPPRFPAAPATPTIEVGDPSELVPALTGILQSLGLSGWADLHRDATRIAARLRREVPDLAGGGTLTWLPNPFVRNRRAFLIARIRTARHEGPLVAAAAAGPAGLAIEALVTTPDEASIVFGFSRSHFQADLPDPRAAVAFLQSLLPTKRLDEIYTVIGYHRHGKREFYQSLYRLLRDPDIRFEPIEGVPGMVMLTFVLKPMNAVFKVIKDRPTPPKQVSRREVMTKYQFVFLTEHGGRLADTQEFTGLALPDHAFTDSVRQDLIANARETVEPVGDRWIFKHLYTERRMTPLDVFLRTAPPGAAEAAIVDFGRAIKELAGINVFPGDMLAKNFGVTRHGRVIFYDYDEICPLTDCSFRTIPQALTFEDEMAAEPWFSVRESDVFPEEFERFIRFPEPLHRVFRRHHRDLFTAEFWNGVRTKVAGGEITEPAPYRPEHLLP